MNFPFYIARRYLFSKKKHNAINIISGVSVCGVALATLALVCTLSVFNGFQDLVASFFTAFDPQLKITVREGKVFDGQNEKIRAVCALPEVSVSTETLEKYLAGEITMDDVDFSQHKLLKSDMEAVKKLKKEPYDDFSLDKWNLDSDLAKSNLPRLVSLLVGGASYVNDKYIPVYNAYSGQTETMETKWANLKKMEEETFAKIIMGKADISEFDTFVENWKNQGGDQILKEINDELSK